MRWWLLLVSASLLQAADLQLFEAVEPHMGTLFRIKLYAADARQASAAFRASFDRVLGQVSEPYRIIDRITGSEIALSQQDYDDLCRVHLFDWLEQVPRSREWNYRRLPYRKMAERLGKSAEESYESIFAREEVEADLPPGPV